MRLTLLKVFKRLLNWSQLADSMKVIVIYELVQSHSFEEATRLLALTEDQTNYVRELCQREVQREVNEKKNINRCLARQLSMLMSGATAQSEAYNNILEEELYTNIQDPSTFMVSKEDFLKARYFLRRSGEQALIGVAETLWKYYGVESFPLGFGDPEPQSELDHLAREKLKNEYRTPPDMHAYMEPQLGNWRKRRASHPNSARPASPTASPSKRRYKHRAHAIKFTTSSGLRNSVSAGGQGIIGAPSTFQPATSPSTLEPPIYPCGGEESESRKCLAQLRDIDMAIRFATFVPLDASALDALMIPSELEEPPSTPVRVETDNESTGSDRAPSEDEVSQIVVNPETPVVEAPQKEVSLPTLPLAADDKRVEAMAPLTSSAPAILPGKTRTELRNYHHDGDNINLWGSNAQGMMSDGRRPAPKSSTLGPSNSGSEPVAKRQKIPVSLGRYMPLILILVIATRPDSFWVGACAIR
jgi:hypothetical protein